MNKNKQKWRTKSKGEMGKHEWNNRNINGGEKKNKEVERKKLNVIAMHIY